jgi:hypothetical protein
MLKKCLFALMSSMALLAVTGAFAQVPAEPCDEKLNVCCKEPAPGPFAFSYPRELNLSCPKDFYFDAQFLLMQTQEEGLEYSITQKDSHHNGYPLTEGDVQDYTTGPHKWGWNYGFRLIAGCYLNHDVWNLDAQYTFVRIKHDHGYNATGKDQLPFWADNTDYFDNASLRWVGNINVFDLSLGKPYHVSRHFFLSPLAGLRMGWIGQDYLFRYGDVGVAGSVAELVASTDYWGVGLRAGIKSEWVLDNNWSFFGHVAGSMMYSHFDVDQNATTTSGALDYTIHHEFYTNLPNIEIGLGLSFGQYFNDKKDHYAITVAYEFNDRFKMNRLRQFTAATNPSFQRDMMGDLTYSGLTFGLNFDF